VVVVVVLVVVVEVVVVVVVVVVEVVVPEARFYSLTTNPLPLPLHDIVITNIVWCMA